MIYNPNSRVKLFGEEADNFLAEAGISLYEDCIVLEGEQAEAYKASKAATQERIKHDDDKYDFEHGSRFTAGDKFAKGHPHYNRTNQIIDKYDKHYDHDLDPDENEKNIKAKMTDKEKKIVDHASKIAEKDHERQFDSRNMARAYSTNSGKREDQIRYSKALDAANRHMRRHPEQYKESAGIFSNADFME